MVSVESKPLFRDLTAEDPDPECTEIESLCMNCHENGKTRLLLTRIPHYKNVVLMSFSCEVCGYANNEIQPGGAFADMGVRWKLRVESPEDLDRQVVKSDYTGVRISEVDFEIPPQSQRGEVTTVEGIIRRAVSGLLQDQESRRIEHEAEAKQIDAFVATLTELVEMRSGPFTVEFEDASGNTFVENPSAPRRDPRCVRTDFKRTADQDHLLGIYTQQEAAESFPEPAEPAAPAAPAAPLLAPCDPAEHSYARLEKDELMTFHTNCPECNAPADTRMKLTHIPHFKEVLIMATTCDACGHRSNEVKSSGGIEERGVRMEVRVAGKEDFSRDILKAETCSMEIPELELEVGGKALGGRFTTAEGLLRATSQQLGDGSDVTGDAPCMSKGNMDRFLATLEEVLEGRRAVTIVLDDPAGNSYVQSLNDDNPDEPDDGLKVTRYVRTHEQNDELGINDMKTEGYEQSS